ncbi:MAG: hypothetical protein HeimC2_26700 [Candidatus Heimdallarchaeota archaeon LC_2]|nr:MAG: hypothetical protein HeimC2_26700 [Candidatus Heimdallarchaeota archaeon LC_2]
MTDIQIELLYFSDCENYRKACDAICYTIGEKGLNASIKLISVNEKDDLKALKFSGSPTVIINGKDVEDCFNQINEIEFENFDLDALACRIYVCDTNRGCPSEEMITCALEQI